MSFLNKSDVKNHLSTRSRTVLASWPAKSPNANGLEDLSDDKRSPSGPGMESAPVLPPPMHIASVDTLIPSGTDAAVTEKLQP